MALFIAIEVAPETADDPSLVDRLVEVCPVDIFAKGAGGGLEIFDANVDECTLCELCLAVGSPGSVRVRKLYDDGRELERSA